MDEHFLEELLSDDPARAVECLRRGGLVGLPTETVYGLAADAANPAAVERIFAVKGRPAGHPLIVHAADTEMLEGWVSFSARRAENDFVSLADACWPGPLTLLVGRGPKVRDQVTGGRPTVAVRVPAHPVATDVLTRLGGPVAAPSANLFGRVSPTTAAHVLADLGGLLDPARDVVLDGGRSTVGVESTIVDLTVTPAQVLRAGAIDATTIGRLLDSPVADPSGPERASGMLTAHYAPRVEVVLAESADEAGQIASRRAERGQAVAVLDRTDDLVVAAHELYADLRAADARALDALIVVLPPPTGLGLALRDRLTKAAAGSARSVPGP